MLDSKWLGIVDDKPGFQASNSPLCVASFMAAFYLTYCAIGSGKGYDLQYAMAAIRECGAPFRSLGLLRQGIIGVQLVIYKPDRFIDLWVRHAQAAGNQLHENINPLDVGCACVNGARRR